MHRLKTAPQNKNRTIFTLSLSLMSTFVKQRFTIRLRPYHVSSHTLAPLARLYATARHPPSPPSPSVFLSLDALYGQLKRHSRTRQWQQCVDLVHRHAKHASLDHRFFGRVITIVGVECGQLEAAWDVYRLMVQRRVRPDVVIMNTLVSAAVRAHSVDVVQRRQMVQQMISEMKHKFSITPNAVTMNMLLSLSLQDERKDSDRNARKRKGKDEGGRRHGDTKADVEDGERELEGPSVSRYEQFVVTLTALQKEHPFESDLQTFTILLQHLLHSEEPLRWDQVKEILEHMNQRNIAKDIVFFNTLLAASVRTKRSHVMFTLLELMIQDGCRPNVVTINTLLNNMSEIGDNRVFKVFEVIVELAQQSSNDSFNGKEEVEGIHEIDEDEGEIATLRRVLSQVPVEINTITYTMMIKACSALVERISYGSSRHIIERAWKYVRRMKRDQIVIDNLVINHLLTLLTRYVQRLTRGKVSDRSWTEKFNEELKYVNAKVHQVMRMMQHIQDKCVSTGTYNALLNLVVECGNSNLLFDIFQRIDPSEADSITLNTALKACREMHRKIPSDTCIKIYQRLKHRTDDLTFVLLFGACERYRDAKLFETIFMEWKSLRYDTESKSSQKEFLAMINAATTVMTPVQVMSLVRLLTENNILLVDAAVCSLMIKACTRHMQVDQGIQWHEEMKRRADVKLDETYYTQLLELCEVHADLDRGKHFINEMQQEFKLQPNIHTYYALLKVALKAARRSDAIEDFDAEIKSCMQYIEQCAGQIRDQSQHNAGQRATTPAISKKILMAAQQAYGRHIHFRRKRE